jgi:hypothetical protein
MPPSPKKGMSQAEMMEQYNNEQKKGDKLEKKRQRQAQIEKKRADREKRIQDKKDAEELRLRLIREAEEARLLEIEERTSWWFYLERGGKHFPTLEHKQHVMSGGRDIEEFYIRLSKKLGIENNFVVQVQNLKTFEWTEFEEMFEETTGPKHERRARLLRHEDAWFPGGVNDKTECSLCGNAIGSCRRRCHPGLASHKNVPRGVHTFEMAAGPFYGSLAPMCKDQYEHLQWHMKKFRPETRHQICGACWMHNEINAERNSYGNLDNPQNQLDPWGVNPQLHDEGDEWHFNCDPGIYRLRNLRSEWGIGKEAERKKRAVNIKEWKEQESKKERARERELKERRAMITDALSSSSSSMPSLQLVSIGRKASSGGSSTALTTADWDGKKAGIQSAMFDGAGGDKDALQQQVREAFESFDTDGTGHIDVQELGALTAALEYPMGGDDLVQLMAWLDKSGDGLVSLDEFMDYWTTF